MNELLMELTLPDTVLLRDEVTHDMVLAFNNVTQNLIVLKGRSRYLFLELINHGKITDAVLEKIYSGMSGRFFENVDSTTWQNEVIQFATGLRDQGFLQITEPSR